MTFSWKEYLVCEIVETSVFSILILILYLAFTLSPWILILLFALWYSVVCDLKIKKTDVIINTSGIMIDDKCIKWDNVNDVHINTFRGSMARKLVIMTKNSCTHEFCFFPRLVEKSSLMVDYNIRKLSENRIIPQACFWVRYFDYPICKFVIKFVIKSGEGNQFKTDGGSQNPHVHDKNHTDKKT